MGLIVIGQTNKKILSGRLQRKLRNSMTDAERALWRVLRGRQISGVKFRRQHPFDNYILDFASLEIKLVIEVDGSQHAGQTHPHPGPPLEGEGGNRGLLPLEGEGGRMRVSLFEREGVGSEPPRLEGEGELLCEADAARTKKLEADGFRVLRFWNNEVLASMDAVEEKIRLTVQEIKLSP